MSSDTFTVAVERLDGATVDLRVITGTAGGADDYACTRSFALLCLVDLLRDHRRAGPLLAAVPGWPADWYVSEDFMRRELDGLLVRTRILSRELAKRGRPHTLGLRVIATDPRWLEGLETGLRTGTTAYDVWWRDPTRPELPPPGTDGALPELAAELRRPVAKSENAARVQRIKRLIADGADPNEATTGACPEGGCLPLSSALTRYGNDTVITPLLEAGARLDAVDPHTGRTPLHEAAAHNHKRLVKLALDSGIHPEIADHAGQTPLHSLLHSAYTADLGLVGALLAAGANIEARDAEGRTPAAIAARHQGVAALKRLRKAGARMDTRDDAGRTLLHHAAGAARKSSLSPVNEVETLTWLLDEAGLPLDARDHAGQTVLAVAEARKHKRILAFLQGRGLGTAET